MNLNKGESVVIKGDLSAAEDLTFGGHVEGTVDLRGHTLTVGPRARVLAKIIAKSVIVLGSVSGDVRALERCELQSGGVMEGTLTTPRLAMADGAVFQGGVLMPTAEEAKRG